MKVKKTISRPIIAGLIFGTLSFLISAANITIAISKDLILGPWELLNTISAVLFGPISLLITQLGMDIGGYFYLIKGVFPAPQDVYFMICEYISHTLSLLVLMFCYRFIHQRMKMPFFLVGWSLSLGIYYVLLAVLQVTLYNIAVPSLGASYAIYFRNIPVELILIIFLTSLILLALPERYRKPQWFETKKASKQNSEIRVNWKEGAK